MTSHSLSTRVSIINIDCFSIFRRWTFLRLSREKEITSDRVSLGAPHEHLSKWSPLRARWWRDGYDRTRRRKRRRHCGGSAWTVFRSFPAELRGSPTASLAWPLPASVSSLTLCAHANTKHDVQTAFFRHSFINAHTYIHTHIYIFIYI